MPKTIELTYIKGLVPESELELISSQLKGFHIELECQDISGEPQAAVEELLAPVILFLSSDVVQVYLLGLAKTASYDLIKNSVISIWRHVSGKSIQKITPMKVESSLTNFDLDIRTKGGTRVKFKLKGDIPDSIKEKCVDKAFQLLETKAFPEIRTGYICLYNVDHDKWEVFESLDFVKRFVKPKDS